MTWCRQRIRFLVSVLLLATVFVLIGQSTLATDELPDPKYQNLFSMQLINQINVLRELRKGHGEALSYQIESALPGYLKSIAGFKTAKLKSAAFLDADSFYKSEKKVAPGNLAASFASAIKNADQVVSPDCYEQGSCTGGFWCFKALVSLTPVNPDKISPMGWHYIIDSHCGFKLPKFWELVCGPPLGLTACANDASYSKKEELFTTETTTTEKRTTSEEKITTDEKTPSEELPAQEFQDYFCMQIIDQINVLKEIRAAHTEKLSNDIEEGLPQYLTVLAKFADSPLKTAAFYDASLFYKEAKKAIPDKFTSLCSAAVNNQAQVLSADCYELGPCTGEKGCHKWPTSLQAVDLNKKSPMGWQYIVDSHCGFHWPKFWNLDCGPPLGLTACTRDGDPPTPGEPPPPDDNPTTIIDVPEFTTFVPDQPHEQTMTCIEHSALTVGDGANGKTRNIKEALKSGRYKMQLSGDGTSTATCQISLTDTTTGKTTKAELHTLCISKKTLKPPPSADQAQKESLHYTIGDPAPPEVQRVVTTSKEMYEKHAYDDLAIPKDRLLKTMMQLCVWMIRGGSDPTSADAVSKESIKDDFLKKSDTNISTLSSTERKEFSDKVSAIFEKVDETVKLSKPPSE